MAHNRRVVADEALGATITLSKGAAELVDGGFGIDADGDRVAYDARAKMPVGHRDKSFPSRPRQNPQGSLSFPRALLRKYRVGAGHGAGSDQKASPAMPFRLARMSPSDRVRLLHALANEERFAPVP
jgi:hypothetical protein